MQATLTSLANPRWANAEQTMIDCEITTSQFGEEILPFTAAQNDIEAHGRAIFAAIVAGEYGPISDYVPVVLATPDQIAAARANQPTVLGAQTL